MADVRDRAQLILITGLLLAVSFVVLTLLLNTVIYTENLASRGTDTGGEAALEYRATVETGVGELIDRENERGYSTHSQLRNEVRNGTDEIDRTTKRFHVQRGVASNVSDVSLDDGTLLRQTDPSRDLSNRTGTANWTLVEDVTDVRSFAVEVTGGLKPTTNPEDQAFNVSLVDASGDRWSVYVYDDGGGTIAVQNASDSSPTEVCGPVTLPVRIDLTRGTVDGQACEAIDFGRGTGVPRDVVYHRGDRADGTYGLTVNTTTDVVDQNFVSSPSTSAPYQVPAVYSARVDVAYVSSDLRYGARIRVARGEPR